MQWGQTSTTFLEMFLHKAAQWMFMFWPHIEDICRGNFVNVTEAQISTDWQEAWTCHKTFIEVGCSSMLRNLLCRHLFAAKLHLLNLSSACKKKAAAGFVLKFIGGKPLLLCVIRWSLVWKQTRGWGVSADHVKTHRIESLRQSTACYVKIKEKQFVQMMFFYSCKNFIYLHRIIQWSKEAKVF